MKNVMILMASSHLFEIFVNDILHSDKSVANHIEQHDEESTPVSKIFRSISWRIV